MRFTLLACFSLMLLASCSDKTVDIKGDQIAVLESQQELNAELSNISINLPAVAHNKIWAQAGLKATHNVPHLALNASLTKVFDRSIGAGSSRNHRLLATPVVGDYYVYSLDARGMLMAFDKTSGKKIFSVNTRPKDEALPIGHGGLAYGRGVIYIATGYAELIAVDALNGTYKWRVKLSAPARSAPTYAGDKVFVTTVDNIVHAHYAGSGQVAWDYTGLSENSGLLGIASPAVHHDTVIVPFSSGEIITLLADTGQPLWGEALTTSRRSDAVSNIATIKAHPVIENGRVYTVGHAGRMMALELMTGDLIWEKMIGGTQTPLVIGNVVYVVSENAQLYALRKSDGKIIWKKTLQAKAGKKDIHWQGPILAGGHLILTNSLGQLVFASPKTGDVIHMINVKTAFELPPIVAAKTLYLLSDRGNLIAFR